MTRTFKAALLCAATLLPVATFAQQPANTPPSVDPNAGLAAAPNADTLGDIVVTARKVAENLQDVPLAITAFSAAEIKSARIESIGDVAKLTAGLNYTPLFGRQNQLPIIRGAAQTLGQSNVGVFLDGIYLTGKGAIDLELNDLERVEVVRGPQSALYGRNTFAGAINYVTKRPSADLGGNIEGTIGTNGLHKVQASLSGPLGTDKVRFRIGGYYRDFDGWYRSGIDGGRVDFEKSYGGIGTLELTPTEKLTATFRVAYSKNDDGQPPSSVIRDNGALGTPSGGSALAPRNLIYFGEVPVIPKNGVLVNTVTAPGQPSPYGDREEAVRASGTLEYDFGGVTATSITAYAHRDAEYTYDGDNTICDRAGGCPNFGFPFVAPNPVGASRYALSSNKGTYRDVSEELRLGSSGKQRVSWLVGFYYYDNRTVTADRGFSGNPAAAGPLFSGFNPNYSFPRITQTTKSYSGFGSIKYQASEAFSLTGELRYESEKQTFNQCPTYYANPAPLAGIPLGVQACGATPSPIVTSAVNPFTGSQTVFPSPAGTAANVAFTGTERTFHFVTPRIIADLQLDHALLYASYSRGAKTGGFNTGLNVFPDQRAYDPETSNNFELGVKSDLIERHLRLNVAGYYIDWNNQQATCQNPITAGGSSTNRSYLCNVAASSIYGLEVETAVRFNDILSLTGNYTYTHARYDRFVDDSLAQSLALAGLPAIGFHGKHLPYVPDHKVVLSPRLDLPFGDKVQIEARADFSYQSKTYLRADNLQNFGSKTNLDLRLTGHYEGFSLQFFANNVLNNKRPVAGVRFFDSTNFSVSSPLVQGAPLRELGVTAGFRF